MIMVNYVITRLVKQVKKYVIYNVVNVLNMFRQSRRLVEILTVIYYTKIRTFFREKVSDDTLF